jgi:hypothetical protein
MEFYYSFALEYEDSVFADKEESKKEKKEN